MCSVLRLLTAFAVVGANDLSPEGSTSTRTAVPRRVRVSGRGFIDAATGAPVVLVGTNVVVKGPPWLPEVNLSGNATACGQDIVDEFCAGSSHIPARGNCSTCTTFNEADIKYLQSRGENTIRLAVVWAGAQPDDANHLDPAFLKRLHAVLTLCDKHGMNVVLDNHGDMVGSAGCGNGIPMWFQKRAAPSLIGKPLRASFPFMFIDETNVEKLPGWKTCGDDESKWAEHAGHPYYNLVSECCRPLNSDVGGYYANPIALGASNISQLTMDYLVFPGEGRDAFVRFWRLMAQAVMEHPSAIAAELMNEPVSLRRKQMFDTWREAAEAIHAIIPDMAVSLADTIEGAVVPSWVTKLLGADIDISKDTESWIIESDYLFYTFHYYSPMAPLFKSADEAVANALALGRDWDVPTFLTEYGGCDAQAATQKHGVSHTYWHYSAYCTTSAEAFGPRAFPTETFGACILGWASGELRQPCARGSSRSIPH